MNIFLFTTFLKTHLRQPNALRTPLALPQFRPTLKAMILLRHQYVRIEPLSGLTLTSKVMILDKSLSLITHLRQLTALCTLWML
jgi:hypothetical protein